MSGAERRAARLRMRRSRLMRWRDGVEGRREELEALYVLARGGEAQRAILALVCEGGQLSATIERLSEDLSGYLRCDRAILSELRALVWTYLARLRILVTVILQDLAGDAEIRNEEEV